MAAAKPRPPSRRGFRPPCLLCRESGTLLVPLGDLSCSDAAFRCEQCNKSFTLADVKALVEPWTRVLAWLDDSPELDP